MPKADTKARKTLIDVAAIRARDVMQTDVLTLRPDDTVESAIALLEEYHVTGAPVVDESGRLLGVLSASDIARREHVERGKLSVERSGGYSPDDDEGIDEELYERDDYSAEVRGDVRIQDWMSPGIVSVAPSTTLVAVCRAMRDESIHRVFVVEGGELRGVVSTSDLVRLIADAGA